MYRIACVFGSYGWAVKEIEDVLREGGVELAQAGLGVKYIPDENEMKRCYEYGKDFAKIIKGGT